MWQLLLGIVGGFALGWWLDWYLNRQEFTNLREEVSQRNAMIAKLQRELIAQQPAQAPKRRTRPQPEPQPPEEAPAETVTAYCVKCKETRVMQNPRRVTLSNGRPALKGICPVCGSGLFRMVKM
jgi:hypothetical protein